MELFEAYLNIIVKAVLWWTMDSRNVMMYGYNLEIHGEVTRVQESCRYLPRKT
jgi:hypothetical protein